MQTVRLHDGRRLGYAEWGPADGAPVVYGHGLLGSPLHRRDEVEAVLAELGVRWISVHRPGFGVSDPLRRRTLLDFAVDLEQLADALGLGRLRIVAVSAGAPYALGCAAALGERVAGLALVGALAPPDVLPPRREGGWPQRAACRATLAAPPRALRGRVAAVADDLRVVATPWGFDPSTISQEVLLWHGGDDTTVSLAHTDWLMRALPGARVTLCPGERHFLFRRKLAEVLGALVRPSGQQCGEPGPQRLGGTVDRQRLLDAHLLPS